MTKYKKFEFINDSFSKKPFSEDEKILWDAKPQKKAYIINQVIEQTPFVLIWLLVDIILIFACLYIAISTPLILLFAIPFFSLHLIPVWSWIKNIKTKYKDWLRTIYYITDKQIVIQTGIEKIEYISVPFKDILGVSISTSKYDHYFGVADIIFDIKVDDFLNIQRAFLDVTNANEAYTLLQSILPNLQR